MNPQLQKIALEKIEYVAHSELPESMKLEILHGCNMSIRLLVLENVIALRNVNQL